MIAPVVDVLAEADGWMISLRGLSLKFKGTDLFTAEIKKINLSPFLQSPFLHFSDGSPANPRIHNPGVPLLPLSLTQVIT